MPNAITGGVDFSLLDALSLNAYTFNAPNGFAGQHAYATADIGGNDAIQLRIIGVHYDNVDILAFDAMSLLPK
jgi:hypothetical protein